MKDQWEIVYGQGEVMAEQRGWVGVDLDGTLAVYDKWRGIEHIGEPIPAMVKYVQELIEAGVDVRVFTARCQEGQRAVELIAVWCLRHIGHVLPITATKDFGMVFLIDDRAVAVEKNTGRLLSPPFSIASVQYHYSTENPENPAYVPCQ